VNYLTRSLTKIGGEQRSTVGKNGKEKIVNRTVAQFPARLRVFLPSLFLGAASRYEEA
jgi:hypothetical protein